MTGTLVLDIGHQPAAIIPWHKAIGLLQRGAATLVENYQETVYTNEMDISVYDHEMFGPLGSFFDEELLSEDRVRISLNKPAVIRIFKKMFRKKTVIFSRHNVYLRDQYRCQYRDCKTMKRHKKKTGRDFLDTSDLTFDHVIPKSKGGKTTWENIATCCKECNTRKDNKLPKEAGMQLIKKPIEPKYIPIVIDKPNTPDEWRDWLYWNVELDD